MSKILLLVIPLILIPCYTSAQVLSRDVISSQGDFDSNTYMTLEWTLGDSFIGTVANQDNIFTQGFIQSFAIAKTIPVDIVLEDHTRSVIYPNPVSSVLNIKAGEEFGEELTVALFDFSGRYIGKYMQHTKDLNTSLNVSNLQSGIYFIRISNSDDSLVETHKMVKY